MSDQVGGKSEALLLSVQDTVFNPSLRMLGTMFRLDSRIAGDILGSAPREPTFKLVRDTRFSHDKSPPPSCLPDPHHIRLFRSCHEPSAPWGFA